jgi:ABC-type transport system involved in multi-copper enzyme maturation permease subunit
VNRTLILTTLLQRATSPVRMALVGAGFFLPLLTLWFLPMTGFASLDNGFKFGLVLGAGIIGQDLSAGVLQLLFARPITRASYVMSRWAGCAIFAAGLAAVQVLCGALILEVRGMPFEMNTALAFGASQVLAAVGIVSVLTLFSTLIGGLGDLGLYLLASILGGALTIGGQVGGNAAVRLTGEEIGRFLTPVLNFERMIQSSAPSWFEITSFLSTVALCLALAVWLINRKELSYASSS